MIALSINLNKIALLRNSREGNYPNVVEFGRRCLDKGANGITVHPRPDGRHIRPHDVYALRELVAEYPHAEFNIEGNPFAPAAGDYPGLLKLVADTRPHQCTLVPDSDSQLTSDHGFDMATSSTALQPIIEQLKTLQVRSSLFMDPDNEQISLCQQLGADRIELYTGPFAHAHQQQTDSLDALFKAHQVAAIHADALGLGVNAGHDLNLHNMPLYKTIPHLKEVSIGHAFTVDALLMGFDNALEAYLDVCSEGAGT